MLSVWVPKGGVNLPRDLPVLVDNNICIVDIWMNSRPVASVMFRDNILSNHGPLNKIVNHHRGLLLA
jgi:hypothetical protein